MSTDANRERFEAWVKTICPGQRHDILLQRYNDPGQALEGYYCRTYIRGAWEGWQAALRMEREDKQIVGYMVHSHDMATAALYPLIQRAEAFEAARRWNCCLTALVCAPNTPETAT